MGQHENDFLELYRKYRFEDQLRFYKARQAEFETARVQAINLNTLLMILAGVAATLAAVNLVDLRLLWSVLAALFPLLATAVSAYDRLYAFDRQAKLYQDALNALYLVRASAPDATQPSHSADDDTEVRVYVQQVEGVLRREQAQWGQLISEAVQIDVSGSEPSR